MSSVSFKASYIAASQFLNFNNNMQNAKNGSFVEIDFNNKNDINALKRCSFATPYLYKKEETPSLDNYYKKHVYALTAQTDTFEQLNPDEIVGLAAVEENMETKNKVIKEMALHPNARKGNDYTILTNKFSKLPLIYEKAASKVREYNHVRTALLNKLKQIYSELYIKCTEENAGYFLHHNFKPVFKNSLMMNWKKI